MVTWQEDLRKEPPVVYDGLDPEDVEPHGVLGTRFGTVMAVGMVVLTVVIVVAQIVMAVRR